MLIILGIYTKFHIYRNSIQINIQITIGVMIHSIINAFNYDIGIVSLCPISTLGSFGSYIANIAVVIRAIGNSKRWTVIYKILTYLLTPYILCLIYNYTIRIAGSSSADCNIFSYRRNSKHSRTVHCSGNSIIFTIYTNRRILNINNTCSSSCSNSNITYIVSSRRLKSNLSALTISNT